MSVNRPDDALLSVSYPADAAPPTGDAPTTQMALGYDAFPAAVVDRANRVLAVAEAKIAMLEAGLVDVSELDDYEWVVDQESAYSEVSEYLVLALRVEKRIA